MARWFKEWREERKKKPELQIADGTPYFNFNLPNDYKENPHFFMSEELLSPFVNSCDTQRSIGLN